MFAFTVDCSGSPKTDSTTISLQLNIDLSQHSSIDVQNIYCKFSRENGNTREITQSISANKAVFRFDKIPNGYWRLLISLLNSHNEPLYFFSREYFLSNELNEKINLTLIPETGELHHEFPEKSNSDTREYIYIYSDQRNLQPKIFRYSLEDSTFQQVTFWYRTVRPVYYANKNKILFTSYITVEWMEPDGTNRELLYQQPRIMSYPTINQTRQKIFFYTPGECSPRQIASVNIDGTGFQYLFPQNRFDESQPEVILNGDSLLFKSNRSGPHNIYILNLNTSEIVQVNNSRASSSQPHWAPQSDGIYFRDRNADDTRSIMYHNLESGETSEILKADESLIRSFSISPDESSLALVGRSYNRQGSTARLSLYNINTGKTHTVFEAPFPLGKPNWVLIRRDNYK